MSRHYFLRKLRSFNVCSKMLEIFHQSVVASVIFFAAVCWSSSIRASGTNRLDKIIKKAGSVFGRRLETFETVMERRTLNKLLTIMNNDQHPLHHTVTDSGAPSLTGCCSSAVEGTYRKSFLPHCPITAKTLVRTHSLYALWFYILCSLHFIFYLAPQLLCLFIHFYTFCTFCI